MEMTLQLFSWSYNIHRLGASDIALLKQKAEQGDPQYSYMYGRYHYCVRPEPDSVAQAYNLYKVALEGGVVDAKVALAIMWYAGDMGMVNVEKGSELLFEAIDGDSSFACQKYLLDMIVGLNGMLPNPEQAAKLTELAVKGLNELAQNGPDQDKFNMAIENLKKNIPESRISNSYWMGNIRDFYRYGEDNDAEYEAAVNSITVEDVKNVLQAVLAQNNMIQVTSAPKN